MKSALIDTNVLIYATLAADWRFQRARDVVLGDDERWGRRYVATQNLGEMYSTLTGSKVNVPDTPAVASAKIRAVAHLPHVTVLPVTNTVVQRALVLCEEYVITLQRYFDVQLMAAALEHGIDMIFTENTKDFADVAARSDIAIVNPFAPDR